MPEVTEPRPVPLRLPTHVTRAADGQWAIEGVEGRWPTAIAAMAWVEHCFHRPMHWENAGERSEYGDRRPLNPPSFTTYGPDRTGRQTHCAPTLLDPRS